MPVITVENAQIKTAAVEIKTLTISGKQVTLSVFRQVQEEDLIDHEKLKLNGIPWGNINYFWKDKGNELSDYNIIWQKGKELRRFVIPKEIKKFENIININRKINEHESHMENYIKVPTDYYDRISYRSLASDWIMCNKPFLQYVIKNINSMINRKNAEDIRYHLTDKLKIKIHDNFTEKFLTKEQIEITRNSSESDNVNILNELIKKCEDLIKHSEHAYSVVEKNELIKMQDERKRLTQGYNEILDSLKDLPHLFIAI